MSRRVKVFFEERKKSIKLSLFFFRELFVNSIQNNPTRYTKRETTYRSGVDGEPGASLGGSSGSLEVDLFVRATIIHWRGEERGASVSSSVLLDWTSKEIDEKIRDQASSHPYGMKFQNPHSRPLRACEKKRRRRKRDVSARACSVASSLASTFARDACAFSSRRGKKIHPRVRVVVVYVVVVGGFSACVIHLFVFGAEKKRPSLQKKKTKKSTRCTALFASESALARGLATENASSVRGQTGGGVPWR